MSDSSRKVIDLLEPVWLGPDDVHVWLYDINDKYSLNGTLTDSENAESAKYQCETSKREYILTRQNIRSLLSAYYPSVPPLSWNFQKNEYGKPGIKWPDHLIPVQFNISHSGGKIAIAISRNSVGIDIQKIITDRNLSEIVTTHFSGAEQRALSTKKSDEYFRNFFELWTLKEALIKVHGKSPDVIQPRSISFQVENGRVHTDQSEFQFYLKNFAQFVLAIAVGPEKSQRYNFKFNPSLD